MAGRRKPPFSPLVFNGRPKMPNYVFRLEEFRITNTRARHEDTVHVTFAVQVGGKTFGPIIRHMGNRNNGTHPVGIEIGPVSIDSATAVTITFLLVNNGHQNDQQIEAAVRAGIDQAFRQIQTSSAIGTGQLTGQGSSSSSTWWLEFGKIAAKVLTGFLFA